MLSPDNGVVYRLSNDHVISEIQPKFEGTHQQKRAFFAKVYGMINNALSMSVSLRPERLDPIARKQRLAAIGEAIEKPSP